MGAACAGALSMIAPSAFAATGKSGFHGSTTTNGTNVAASTASTLAAPGCFLDAPNVPSVAGKYGIGAKVFDWYFPQYTTVEALCDMTDYSGSLSTNKKFVAAESALADAGYDQNWFYYYYEDEDFSGYLPTASTVTPIVNDLENAASDLNSLLAHTPQSSANQDLFYAEQEIAQAAGDILYSYEEYWYGDSNEYVVFALDILENNQSNGDSAYEQGQYASATDLYLQWMTVAYQLAAPYNEL